MQGVNDADGAGVLQERNKYPRNEIVFVGRGISRSKYIIIPKSDEKAVGELVENHLICGLDNFSYRENVQTDKFLSTIPEVLISVTGGAQDFAMVPAKVGQVFNGLIKAAQNINAWIVDGGMDAGVMSYIGNAIKEMAIENVPCIGIAPYKKVIQHELLGRKANTPKPAEYVADKQNSKEMCALNPNHSHFILVDSPVDTWGQEIDFRTNFESYIRDKFKIPFVVIVVNGGPGTLETVASAVERDFRVVIVQGSGRVSDAIASLVQKAQKINQSLPALSIPTHTCSSLMSINDEVDTSPWFDFLRDAGNNLILAEKWTLQMNTILRNLNSITLYNLNNEASTDMDVYVLRAILSSVNQEDNAHALEEKLKLGIMWDRLDIVEEILDDSKNDGDLKSKEKRKALNNAMMYAIQMDRPKIFAHLVANGAQKESLDLSKYYLRAVKRFFRRLPEHGVTRAYKKISRQQIIHRNNTEMKAWEQEKKDRKEKRGKKDRDVVMYRQISDRNVEFFRLVFLKLGHAFNSYYKNFIKPTSKRDTEKIGEEDKKLLEEIDTNPESKVSFVDVLIWSVFVNRLDLAKEAWKLTKVPIHSALLACRLYRHLADHSTNKEEYLENADWFEDEAIKLMNAMSYEDVKEGLMWKWQKMGNRTALDFAQDSQCKKFVNHTHVQSYLDDCFYSDHYGSIEPTTNAARIWITILFPFFIFSIYNHHDDTKSKFRVYQFYNIPIVKFWTNTFFYCGFLFVQAYTLCTLNAGDDYIVSEYILWLWVCAKLVDEVMQFSKDPQDHFRYLSNYLDFLVLVLHLTYMVLRWTYHLEHKTDERLISGSINVLIIACIFSWARLLNVFAISNSLGPLYFIIIRLFKDIFLWISVFAIFACSFQLGFVSITKQVGMNPADRYPYGTFPVAFFTIIGEYSYAAEWLSPAPLGVTLLAIYAFIAQILLVNLLIAMMGDTYSNVSENSALEWKFYRLELMMENRSASLHPPPLNLIFPFKVIGMFIHQKFVERKVVNINAIEEQKAKFEQVLNKMRIARDDVLDKENESEANSISTIVTGVKDSLKTLTIERAMDRKFMDKSFDDLRKTLSTANQAVSSGPVAGLALDNLQTTFGKLQSVNETLVLQNQQILTMLAQQQQVQNAMQEQLSALQHQIQQVNNRNL